MYHFVCAVLKYGWKSYIESEGEQVKTYLYYIGACFSAPYHLLSNSVHPNCHGSMVCLSEYLNDIN